MTTELAFAFACPRCRSPLSGVGADSFVCSKDGLRFDRTEGIWRFLLPQRRELLAPFMRDYESIRRAEGRGSDDPAYYQALPFEDLTGRFHNDWQIRETSFRAFLRHVVEPIEARQRGPLRVLDLGAGSGWLSYRLAQRGHPVAAVDLMDNEFDGLGAHRLYDTRFLPVQAEYDRLPLQDGQAALAIFNAALHYSTDYETTIREALRVLQSDGSLVILDTPIYRDPSSGEAMVREREADFRRRFGFPSDALASENYLTYDRLALLGKRLGLRWRTVVPWYGLRWAIRPWMARLRGRREPARFLLIEGRRG